jgi:hypothetical protein
MKMFRYLKVALLLQLEEQYRRLRVSLRLSGLHSSMVGLSLSPDPPEYTPDYTCP